MSDSANRCLKSMLHASVVVAIGILPSILCYTTARAQAFTGQETLQQAQPLVLEQTEDHVSLGLGVGYAPAYAGSDEYRVLPIPEIDATWGISMPICAMALEFMRSRLSN